MNIYADGDRVRITDKVLGSFDRQHVGKLGKVSSQRYIDGGEYGQLFDVILDDGTVRPFYSTEVEQVDATYDKLAWHKAEIERLEKEIEEHRAVEVPASLPVGSSMFFPPTQLVTKVAEDHWHWFYVANGEIQFHSVSADKAVANDIAEYNREGKSFEAFPADKD